MPRNHLLPIGLPPEFSAMCEHYGITPEAVLCGFIADCTGINRRPWITQGSDERDIAQSYIRRAHGMRADTEWDPDEYEGSE